MGLHRGLLIAIEGGDGSGKTTLIDETARNLAASGYIVIKTREPGGTKLGEMVREILLHRPAGQSLSPYAELCLFLAGRAQHVDEVIIPAIESGKIVLCDRFNASTIAYQGAARRLGVEAVTNMCNFICHGVQPQLTICLDVDPAVGLLRATKDTSRGFAVRGGDRIESEGIAFHQLIREAYHALHAKDPEHFILLDASHPPEVLAAEAISKIHQMLMHR